MATKREQATEHYLRGLECLERGEYEEAEQELLRAVALRPDLADARMALARLACEQGAHELAVERAREALVLDPRLGEGYHWLSVALHGAGRLDEAVEAGRMAVALVRSPQLLTEALSHLVHTCSQAQLYPEVITHCRHLLATRHREPWVYNAMGWAHSRMEQEEEAERCFREALARCGERGPEAGYAYLQLAWLAVGREDAAAALDLSRRAMESDPENLDTRLGAAQLRLELGLTQEALEAARAALSLAETEAEEIDARGALGEACMEAAQFEDAVEHYRRLAELRPDDIWAQLWLSCAYRQAGALGRAIEIARVALDMAGSQDDRAEACLQLGHAQLEVGDLERALECYREAVDLAPLDARARAELGRAHAFRQDWAAAERLMQEAAKLSEQPQDRADAWADLAWVANERADHLLAERHARAALKEHADHGQAWLMLCWSLRAQGRDEESLAAAEQALELARDQHERADAYIEMGHSCGAAGRLSQAAECYQRALDLGHEDAATYDALGWVLYSKQRLAQAERCFQEAIARDPSDPWPLRNLGLLCLDTNRLQEAVAHCERAVTADPQHAPSHLALACCYHERDPQEAIAHNLRALELDQSNPDARHNLAQLYLDSGRTAEAELMAREAAALLPDDPELQAGLAQVLFVAGKAEQSLVAAERAAALDEHLAIAWRCAGLAADRLGQHDLAAQHLRRAAELGDEGARSALQAAGSSALTPEA